MDQMNSNNNNKRDLVSCYRYRPTFWTSNINNYKKKIYRCVEDHHPRSKNCSSNAEENVNGITIFKGHSNNPNPLNRETLGNIILNTFSRCEGIHEIMAKLNHYSDLLLVYSKLHPTPRPFAFKMKIRELELSRDSYIVPDNSNRHLEDWEVFRYRLSRTDADETKYYTCFHNRFIKCEASAVVNADGVVNLMGNHIDPPRYERSEHIGGIIQRAFHRRLAGDLSANTNDQFSDLFVTFQRQNLKYETYETELMKQRKMKQPVPFILEITPVQIARFKW